MTIKKAFIAQYCKTFKTSVQKAEYIFYSAIQCGDIEFIKEIINIEEKKYDILQSLKTN